LDTSDWLSNLISWFPWSINTTPGIVLMLTVGILLWAIGVYKSLTKNSGMPLFKTALITAAIFLIIAAIQDLIFFGFIRKAMTELYHPTTLYGYGFLVTLPALEYLFIKGKQSNGKNIRLHNLAAVGTAEG
jgi:hypothetical protein